MRPSPRPDQPDQDQAKIIRLQDQDQDQNYNHINRSGVKPLPSVFMSYKTVWQTTASSPI